MKISVMNYLTGESFELEVESSYTVKDLKCIIEWKRYVPISDQSIIFQGPKEMSPASDDSDDERTLADYSLKEGDEVLLNIAMRAPIRARKKGSSSQETRDLQNDGPQEVTYDSTWTREHDREFLLLLLEQHRNGAATETELHWPTILNQFNQKMKREPVFGPSRAANYHTDMLKDHLRRYANEYMTVKNIQNNPNFTWDKKRQIVKASDSKWNRYVTNNPEASGYRNKHIPHFDKLEELSVLLQSVRVP